MRMTFEVRLSTLLSEINLIIYRVLTYIAVSTYREMGNSQIFDGVNWGQRVPI